jgi:hypothetical protein
MLNDSKKPKAKRLPKGLRSYVRKLKQEAKATDTVYRPENQYGTASLVVKAKKAD